MPLIRTIVVPSHIWGGTTHVSPSQTPSSVDCLKAMSRSRRQIRGRCRGEQASTVATIHSMQTRPLPENWLRTDLVMAALLMALGCLTAWLSHKTGASYKTPFWQQLLATCVFTLPLIWRRRFPLTSGSLICGLYLTALITTGIDLYASQVTVFLGFFCIGAWSGRRRAAVVTRIIILVATTASIVYTSTKLLQRIEAGELAAPYDAALAQIGLTWTINIVFFGAAWFFGDQGWKRAMEQTELDRANASIQDLQAQLVTTAIAEERVRIARELHDVVAHHVTTMSVQAAAARCLLDTDRERASSALKEVESGARLAVKDLRTMVFTLRSSDGEQEGLPTLDDLAVLATSSRLAGKKVTYEKIGDLPTLSPTIELTLYRVTQEALTNAAKHAGPNATVAVRLRGRGDAVELEIADDGVGMRSSMPGTGTGLVGMRERVTAVGGTLEAGSKPRGGFRVRAEIPVGVEA